LWSWWAALFHCTGMEQAHRDGNVRLDKPHDDDDDVCDCASVRRRM